MYFSTLELLAQEYIQHEEEFFYLSNEEKPGRLGFIGDNTTQL